MFCSQLSLPGCNNNNNNNQQQSTTINNNQQQSTTINNNQQQSTTINNNQQQSTTINNNQQQSTTIDNNRQQSTTTNNNQQQPTTTNNNNNNNQQQPPTPQPLLSPELKLCKEGLESGKFDGWWVGIVHSPSLRWNLKMMVSPKESTLPFWFHFPVPCETLGMVSIPDSQCAPFSVCRIDLANNCHRNISLSQNEAAGVLATQNKHQRCISHCSIVFFQKKTVCLVAFAAISEILKLDLPKRISPQPHETSPPKEFDKEVDVLKTFSLPNPSSLQLFCCCVFSCQSC